MSSGGPEAESSLGLFSKVGGIDPCQEFWPDSKELQVSHTVHCSCVEGDSLICSPCQSTSQQPSPISLRCWVSGCCFYTTYAAFKLDKKNPPTSANAWLLSIMWMATIGFRKLCANQLDFEYNLNWVLHPWYFSWDSQGCLFCVYCV